MNAVASAIEHADTLPKLFLARYREYGDNKIAMMEKDRGIWQTIIWKEHYE